MALREDLGEPFWHLESTLGCHFGTSGPHWRIPEGPWEQQDGHEVANYRMFVDLGVIPGLVYMGFKMRKKRFIFRLVSRSFFYRFLTRVFDVWDFKIVVFAWNVLQTSTFHGNRF